MRRVEICIITCIGFLPLMNFGCDDYLAPEVRIDKECLDNTEEKARFIIDCAEAANPKSDEEGEDLVYQCERTANNLGFKTGDCKKVYQYCNEHCRYQDLGWWVSCYKSPVGSREEKTCTKYGWNRK